MAKKTDSTHLGNMFKYETGFFWLLEVFQVRKHTFRYGDERKKLFSSEKMVAVKQDYQHGC